MLIHLVKPQVDTIISYDLLEQLPRIVKVRGVINILFVFNGVIKPLFVLLGFLEDVCIIKESTQLDLEWKNCFLDTFLNDCVDLGVLEWFNTNLIV